MMVMNRPASHGYTLVVIVFTTVSLAGAGMWWTAVSNQRQDRQLCSLLNAQANAYAEFPPTTPTGQKVAFEVTKLRDQFNCQGRGTND